MSRWLSYSILSALLFGVWLLLAGSLSPGQLLLAALLALILPWTLLKLNIPPTLMRQSLAFVKLAGLVFVDIVRSNIAVSRIVLLPGTPKTSGFIEIPLDLKSDYALTLLAVIVTSTPGTLWVDYSSQRGFMTLHVLDLVDEAAWIKLIKTRYERLLLEIFE